jgi:hypothetical protein
MHVEFHDKGERVEIEDLTFEGIHEARYQCVRTLDELTEAERAIEAADEAEDGTSGQDRESYSDSQDRENYTVST